MKHGIALLAVFALSLVCAAAEYPPRTGNVHDFPNVLTEQTVLNLETSLQKYHLSDGYDLVVVLAKSGSALNGCATANSNYARDLLNAWKVGAGKGDRAGIVIVIFSDVETPVVAGTPPFDTLLREKTFKDRFWNNEMSELLLDHQTQTIMVKELNNILELTYRTSRRTAPLAASIAGAK